MTLFVTQLLHLRAVDQRTREIHHLQREFELPRTEAERMQEVIELMDGRDWTRRQGEQK